MFWRRAKPEIQLKPCLQRWTSPVVNFGRAELRHCCRTPPRPIDFRELATRGEDYFSNNSYILKKRREMMSGARDRDCATCWALEDRGILSPRSEPEHLLNVKGGPDWRARYSTPEEALAALGRGAEFAHSPYPLHLEVTLNNTCNMKCIYCNHNYSSQWAKELVEFGAITRDQLRAEASSDPRVQEYFWRWFDNNAVRTLDVLNVLGGEPLLTSDFYEFCERLMTSVRKFRKSKGRLRFGIVTNLNLNPAQIERFLEFAPRLVEHVNLDLNVSMESVGRKAEYIRYGLNWELWERNLDRLLAARLPHTSVSFQMALNCLCVSSLKDFLQFAFEKYRRFDHPVYLRRNFVNEPRVHSPMTLPGEFAVYLEEAVRYLESVRAEVEHLDDGIGGWVDYLRYMRDLKNSLEENQPTQMQMREFYRWFKTNDERRGTDLLSVFPELTRFWKECATVASAAVP
jgi:hypothetical protein